MEALASGRLDKGVVYERLQKGSEHQSNSDRGRERLVVRRVEIENQMVGPVQVRLSYAHRVDFQSGVDCQPDKRRGLFG